MLSTWNKPDHHTIFGAPSVLRETNVIIRKPRGSSLQAEFGSVGREIILSGWLTRQSCCPPPHPTYNHPTPSIHIPLDMYIHPCLLADLHHFFPTVWTVCMNVCVSREQSSKSLRFTILALGRTACQQSAVSEGSGQPPLSLGLLSSYRRATAISPCNTILAPVSQSAPHK